MIWLEKTKLVVFVLVGCNAGCNTGCNAGCNASHMQLFIIKNRLNKHQIDQPKAIIPPSRCQLSLLMAGKIGRRSKETTQKERSKTHLSWPMTVVI